MNSEIRNYKIDNLRAIAILMVVLGHSIILYSSDWNIYKSVYDVQILDITKKIINILQMPMFFMLSGYLLNREIKSNLLAFIYKKTFRLLLPYLFFGLFYLLPIRFLIKYPNYNETSYFYKCFYDILLNRNNGHLWFLISLFFCLLIVFIVLKLFNFIPSRHYRLASLAFWLFSFIVCFFSNKLPLSNILKYVFWVFYGSFISSNEKTLVDFIKKYKVLCIIAFVLLVISKLLWGIEVDIFCALLFVSLMYTLISNSSSKLMSILSKHSFGIYLIHSPLIYVTFTFFNNHNPIIVIILNFFFALIAFLLSVLLSKTKAQILIGNFNYKDSKVYKRISKMNIF